MSKATPEPTTWRIHLAARKPRKMIIAVIIILLGMFAIAGEVLPQWGPGALLPILLLTLLLLVGSIAEFLFPVTYTLDADGAHARHWGSHRILPWASVRRVYFLPDGIKLSPLTTQSLAESYRGVMLRTPEPKAVYAQIQEWLDAAGVRPEVIGEP
ncbi:MAG: hypothetical protein ACYDBB_19575 [Armatimonadota bacterium]